MSSSTITDYLSTPGEVLLEEFLKPLGVSQYRLAQDIGVDQARISRIIRGQQAVSADTALRLSVYFKTTPQFWLNLQNTYDLKIAESKIQPILQGIAPAVS